MNPAEKSAGTLVCCLALQAKHTYCFFLRMMNNPTNTAINPNPKVTVENSGIALELIVKLSLIVRFVYVACVQLIL